MKITHKFLLLGLIPALAQALICWELFSLLGTVQYYAEKEIRQNLIARKLVSSVAQSMEVAVAAGAYAAMPIDLTAKNLESASKRADKITTELLNLTRDDPQTHDEIVKMIAIGSLSRKEFFGMKKVGAPDELADDSPIRNINIDAVRNGQRFIDRMHQLTKMLDRQNAQLEESRAKQKENRVAAEMVVLAELIFSLLVVAASYLMFRFDFGRRFSNLLQIAQDLALDKPPSTTLAGGDELSELSDALIAAAEARQEAVSQKQMLFQMVTHDLRSPLMAASLVVDTMMQDKTSSEEKRQSRLQGVERSLMRVVALSNDLLTIEKLSSGGLEISRARVDFQETIEQALETVQPLADQKKCRLSNLSPEMLVSIDEDRILQVTVNLLANAIKYSPDGGLIEVNAIHEGSHLRVQVMDRGPGISDKDIKRLFNPFQQVSESDQATGFGLGLAIAKMLVELHDGNIGAMARPGGGTIFWYTLRL